MKSHRSRLIGQVALFVALLAVAPVCRSSEVDSIVSIWAQPHPGKGWIGTGFLISADGQVLTCYHVIRDSGQLTVYRGKRGYSDIDVIAIAPEHDLALLRINHLEGGASYLNLSTDPLRTLVERDLRVFGNPNGMVGQELNARLTGTDYVLSGELRSPDGGDRIFDPIDVKLIPLQMVIYNGVSGGPVIAKSGVIGVISGSFGTGGAIAWAIPSLYASSKQMSVLDKHVRDVRNWPPLKLMKGTSNWNMLRRGLSLTSGLSLAIDSYLSSVDQASAAAQALLEAGREFDNQTQRYHDWLSSKEAEQNVEVTPEDADRNLQPFLAAADNFVGKAIALKDSFIALEAPLIRMGKETDDFFTSEPHTKENKKRRKFVLSQLSAIVSRLNDGRTEYKKNITSMDVRLAAVQAKAVDARTQAERLAYFETMRTELEGYLNDTSRLFEVFLPSAREIGDIAAALVETHSENPVAAGTSTP
jgi:S1-C subfamily serine protease